MGSAGPHLFGFGACHILAGFYLQHRPLPGFFAERIVPDDGFAGAHVFATDGFVAFDFHGYSRRDRLLAHHDKGWSAHNPGWHSRIEPVDVDLLDTAALNARKMLGPDQYLHDPRPRASAFVQRRDHVRDAKQARQSAGPTS